MANLPRIFIHIPKNAGMTIRHSNYLKNRIFVCSGYYHKSSKYTQELHDQMRRTNDHPGEEHCPWRFLRKDIQENNTAFAIIRNPWDRVVSRYFFAKKVIEVEKKVPSSYCDISSFESFLEERHKWGDVPYMWHRAVRGWKPASFHVTDEAGNLKCDMLSFENYNSDVCDYFGLKNMTRARNVTALNKLPYTEIYNKKTEQIVADWYKDDIDRFGYDFRSGPTKNTWRILK